MALSDARLGSEEYLAAEDPVETAIIASSQCLSGVGSFGEAQQRDSFVEPSSVDDFKKNEVRNMLALCCLFSVYFAFRSGCLIVLPLACRLLLRDVLQNAAYSPLYQLPLAVWFAVDIVIATPNAIFMQRHGRRAGFLLGSFGAMVASVGAFCVLRFIDDSITAYILLNVVIIGMATIGMAEFVRFAAHEACLDDTRRSKIVARVISGGAVLSMFGPFTSSFAVHIEPDNALHGYAYFFLLMGGVSIVAIVASASLKLPPISPKGQPSQTPLWSLLKRTEVWSSIVAQVAVQFAMVTPMMATPLTMLDHLRLPHADFIISGCIVSHVLAMFIPGLFSGNIVQQIGALPTMFIGLFLQACCMTTTLLGYRATNFYIGLVALGLGWNLAFVAGTMLLLSSHSAEDRTKVTSFNETVRFIANGVAAILSSTLAWHTVSYTCSGFLALVAGTMLFVWMGQKQQREPLASRA